MRTRIRPLARRRRHVVALDGRIRAQIQAVHVAGKRAARHHHANRLATPTANSSSNTCARITALSVYMCACVYAYMYNIDPVATKYPHGGRRHGSHIAQATQCPYTRTPHITSLRRFYIRQNY
jgi:hypothetical protein